MLKILYMVHWVKLTLLYIFFCDYLLIDLI